MKKFFGFGAGKGRSSPTFRTEPMSGLGARADKNEEVNKSQRGYDVRLKDLKKIHRAAAVGDVAKMQRLLLLGKDVNKRDKMKRTPLHLACTIGHADMVTLLVERKCQLNLCDRECKTPLMKAVQCQEEACVTILLEHGADPHLTDNFGNTALHYAVAGENTSIVEKLILYHANIEARNKFELTPFLLAVNENKHQMVELLIGKKADVHVVDKSKRTALMLAATSKSPDVVRLLLQQGVNTSSRDECGWTAEDYAVFGGFDVNRQIIAQHREERLKNFSQNNNPVTNKTFEEDSLSSISVKPGDDNASWPTSDDEDLSLNMKNTSKPNLRKLMNVSQRFKNLETELGLVSPRDETLFEDDNSDNKCEDTFGVPSKPSVDVCDSSPALPSPDSILKPPFTLLGLGLTKEGEERPAIETKDDGITESVPQAQTVNGCLTSADRADKNDRHVMLSALGFAEQNEESPWDSEVAVRQLQEELADTLKKQSMSEASLEVTSRCRMNLEDEVQDLKKKLAQIRNQLQDAQERHAEAVTRIETLKDHVQKLEVENAELKDTITKQVGKIEQLQENTLSTCSSDDEKGQIKKFIELKQSLECSLNQEMKKNGELEKEITRFKKLLKVTRKKLSEYENEDLSFHGDLRTSHAETDIQINMLKHKVDDLTAKLETLSSKNQVLTLELSSMKEIQTKCEKLEKNKKKLEQQVVNLRSCVEVNMVEYSKIEQYKWELEERTRLNIEEKLKEVDLFLQTQVASQESLAQLRENYNASLRSQMELRIKELEFELLKMKSSQEDLTKTELDRYKHLYLEEVMHRTSLTNELNKTSERLAETSTKLLVEKQQKQTLLDTINMRPSLDLPYGRNVNNSSLFNRNVTLRENVVIPTSNSWRSSKDIGTFLTKMQQELEKNITRELEEVAAEFESGSSGGATALESTFERHINCDDVLKSYREYSQFLKKKYTI
ncbi:ankyrin repeat domain-containing protein 26-like isoform X4 [Mustela erminea]|uniref:ankyrin repeat domain-containing protein 26-like isoform X4 n=1 Tax=Mustela erminea TaxID=36723 RepID=UPI001386D59E|nr:ankyrin repeat domain-containing protein 26-like isoform X4 [Mustela erminea]